MYVENKLPGEPFILQLSYLINLSKKVLFKNNSLEVVSNPEQQKLKAYCLVFLIGKQWPTTWCSF